MRPEINPFLAVGAASALLAACAGSGDQYPSLAIRDAERVTGQFNPSSAGDGTSHSTRPSVAAGDISRIVDQARESHRNFVAAQPSASRLVSGARGSGSESEARAQALVALADLSSKRSDTVIALADLDLMAAGAATEFSSTQSLGAAQRLVLEFVNAQDAALAQLWEQMER